MSAIELLKQVAVLSPHERTLFERLFQAMEAARGIPDHANQTNWPDFGKRLHDIYGEKAAPDSQIILDEQRGNR